jgi:hypothetical protein
VHHTFALRWEGIRLKLALSADSDLGWTGGVRNFMMVFADVPNYALEDIVNAYRKSTATKGNKAERYVAAKNFSNKTARVDALICTGIAEITATAINRAIKLPAAKNRLASNVKAARMEGRRTGIDHAGTLIEMTDNTRYIFDWHMTLAPENPYIFKAENWHNRVGGVTFQKFVGFK